MKLQERKSGRRRCRPAPKSRRCLFEPLEDRRLLAILVVDNPADTAVANELSLRQAVAQANIDAAAGTSDTIAFDSSLGGQTIDLTQGQLELSGVGAGTITIDGSTPSIPVTISTSSVGRAFQVDSGVQAVLANLHIENCSVGNENGGALFNSGNLTVRNATLSGNSASFGGAIENDAALALNNVTFSGNRSNSGSGGAIDSNAGTTTANDCTFTNNSATSAGAIENQNAGALTLSNCTFQNNSATNNGGAIDNVSSTLSDTGSLFTGNSADNSAGGGGGIENYTATATLTGDTFSGNTCYGVGGAVDSYQSTLTLTSVTIVGNTASSNGGGININTGTANINDSAILNNRSYASGAAIENNAGMANLTNSTLTGNLAVTSGGGVENDAGTLMLAGDTLSADTTYGKGGGVDTNAGTLTVQNTIVSANTASSGSPDVGGSITADLGNNLLGTAVNNSANDPTPGPGNVFSDKPLLASLANNGGRTQTMALSAGSPAIGAGNASATLPATDQRGLPRTVKGSLDIGAFQAQAPAIVFTTLGQTFLAGQPATTTVQLQDLDGNPSTAGAGGVTVSLASSSSGATFFDANGNALAGSTITVPQGASSVTFEYRDSQQGTPTLSVAATGFASATQQETILPAPISATPSTNIVVGRTLSAYFTSDVQNNQETITFTVYNQSADAESGVLLTDALASGVTLVSASQQPDQSGQNLAWSLGTIQGYDRASVTITVSLANSSILQLDAGAQAFATLDGGAVSNSTPAATLRAGSDDPNLLASTPDANTTDPYVQEEAAALDYNPQNIFNFLHNDIGYNSYTGSLRGARGTLWSNAGNALDVASLGVALMRASGIPAQYVSGTLSTSQAQQLILSMFPAQYQTVGYIPAGTQLANPANNSKLLSETESHYWLQFDAGQGMQAADPLMASATVGQAFTASTSLFSEVPPSLRQTTEVKVTAEIYSQAEATFGLSGLTENVVLDQTFNDVDLVGRPLTFGNFVSQSGASAVVTAVTNTYSPYLELGDDANPDPSNDQIIRGTDYQEVLTNFPLASQILTGLFLDVALAGAGQTAQTYVHTILDRIGYAARQGLAPLPSISASTDALPSLTDFDLTTLVTSASLVPTSVLISRSALLTALSGAGSSPGMDGGPAGTNAPQLSQGSLAESAVALGEQFFAISNSEMESFARQFVVRAYDDTLGFVAISNSLVTSDGSPTGQIQLALDIGNDPFRALAYPGQATSSATGFQSTQGFTESAIEYDVLAQIPVASVQAASSLSSINQSLAAGAALREITSANLGTLPALGLSPDAQARITDAVGNGLVVLVPSGPNGVPGQPAAAWLELDPASGWLIAVSTNGEHFGSIEYDTVIVRAEAQIAEFGPAYGQIAGSTLGSMAALAVRILAAADEDGVPLQELMAEEENLVTGIILGRFGGYPVPLWQAFITTFRKAFSGDPPAGGTYFAPASFPNDAFGTQEVVGRVLVPGQVDGTLRAATARAAGALVATWASPVSSTLMAAALAATTSSVFAPFGTPVGAGTITLSATTPLVAAISGNNQYNITGTGSLSFYGPAERSLGVSGDWQKYTATVTSANPGGTVSITLTVPEGVLTLNGTALPAGTYTITTNSATLSGSGTMTAPNFAGSASITTTGGTVTLGPWSGSLSSGGQPLNAAYGTTLDGYSGTISVAANGDGTDAVTLAGNSTNVLQLVPSAANLTTDENTPVTFNAGVQTSLADTYSLTANAPQGWTVTIDANGNVTATPVPGAQAGTYPIQLIAQSQSDPNLIAQSTVEVTIAPTVPGMTLAVNPDPIFTVPSNGAEVPTAFRAVIHNTGPTADTYNLTLSSPPVGFTFLVSGTSDSVPAGATGILGIYLQPTGTLPPPGTPESFTVTATSTKNPAITQTVTVTFAMPTVQAITATSNPAALNAVPGQPVTANVTLTNVGNVPDTIALGTTLPSGLTVSGSATPVTLAIGQSTTQTLTLTPAANTPLNSQLQAAINYEPAATHNVVSVVNVAAGGAFADAGTHVNITADVLAGMTTGQQGQASYVIKDSQGNVVFTSASVPLALGVITSLSTVSLGTLDTTGFAPGQYSINVTISDSGDTPIPGATGTLVIGSPVIVNQSVSTEGLTEGSTLTNGSGTVTNTLSISLGSSSSTTSGTVPVTASVVVPTSGAAVVPSSFNLAPTQTIIGTNSETLVWNLSLSADQQSQQITWQTTVTGLEPDEVQQVTAGTTVAATLAGGPENLTLQPLSVTSVPAVQTLTIPVNVVVPGAQALANAADAADNIGKTDLAHRFSDLSIALTNLVQNPTDPVPLSQAQAAIVSIISQLTSDPFLAPYIPSLTVASAALAAATTSTDIDTAVMNLGNALDPLAQALTDEVAHSFTLGLANIYGVVEPGVPTNFSVLLQNTGSATTTYDFSVSGLPAGVTATFNQPSLTLAAGQAEGTNNTITLSLSESANTLVPVNFTVTATAEGAPEITLGTPGHLVLRTESLQVATVSSSPPFTQPGGQVDVKAGIESVLNEARQVAASYTVSDSHGNVLFTSTPVTEILTITSGLTILDLGTFDSTGFANGLDTITVTALDQSNAPLPSATGQGSVMIGLPVTASLSVSPTTMPSGNGTVTNTLTINPAAAGGGVLSLLGQVADTGTPEAVAVNGTLAYVAATDGIDVVDVSDPTNPQVLSTFGQSDVVQGGTDLIKIAGNLLIVASEPSGINVGQFHFLTYSLTNPTSPQLLGNKTFNISYITGMDVDGNAAFFSSQIAHFSFSSGLFSQGGDVTSIDFSNPSAPVLGSQLSANDVASPPISQTFEQNGVVVNSQVAYVTSSTSTGGPPSGQTLTTGEGRLLAVNIQNPSQLTEERLPDGQAGGRAELDVPGTTYLYGIATEGNYALVAGASTGLDSGGNEQGNLTLTVLNVADPLNPQIVTTVDTPNTFSAGASTQFDSIKVQDLGNNQFAVTGTGLNGAPVLEIVNINDPSNPELGAIQVPAALNGGLTAADGKLYLTSSSGLSIFNIGQLSLTPITATVEVPNGSGVSVVASSFNIPPTKTIPGTTFNTLEWNLTLPATTTITWQSTVSNLSAGEILPVTLGATVNFTSQGTPGTFNVPGTSVTGTSIISLIPASQTAQPGGTATYDIQLTNPTNTQVTYDVFPSSDVTSEIAQIDINNHNNYITVGPNSSADIPLQITSYSTATLGSSPFTISAQSYPSGGATGSTQGTLIIVAGSPVPPSTPNAYGVVATVTPSQATAGQGTSAEYVVQLTNTGSTDEKFSAHVNGLPSGVSAAFGQSSVDAPPGASNFRDLPLALSVNSGTSPGAYPFTVTVSASDRTSSTTIDGTLVVVANGVGVTISPSSGTPGRTFQMTVTNTGTLSDTFDLSLGGPAAVVSSLSTNTVTLAPGQSQVVPISTGVVNFADPGALALTAIAVSATNQAVQASATADLEIPVTQGMTAQFSPASQNLPQPGPASFSLLTNDTGNSEDAYTATIIGTTGPITASLIGLDGQPTRTVPIFRLPGLATGDILLSTIATGSGQGTVTVQVTSLSNPAVTVTATATVNASSVVNTAATTITIDSDYPSGSIYGQTDMLMATVSAAAGTPTGSVQFEVDGADYGEPVSLVNGVASVTANLPAGQHSVVAFYTSDTSGFGNSDDSTTPFVQIVTPAPLTVTADNQTKVYGAALPALTASYSGFVNGDTAASLTTPVALSTTAVPGSPVASYPITASGAVDPDYTIRYISGTLSVTPASLTITADSKSNVYGAALPTLTASYSGFVNSDASASLTTLPTLSTTATSVSPVGSYPITASGAIDPNYTISYVSGTLNVTPAALTITADNKIKVYGAALPTLTASYSGFVNSDTPASLTTPVALSTTAQPGSAVASYPITASGAADPNYTISYVGGTLSVTPASLTITADSKTKVYGAAQPTLTASYSGFVNGDTPASLTTPVALSTTAQPGSAVASFPITASGAVDPNYTISYVGGTLSVTPASLTITADSKAKVAGTANPPLTFTASGFVNGDTLASLTTQPTLSTTATTTSPASTYPITVSGALDPNYTISYVNGTLTISSASTIGTKTTLCASANPITVGQWVSFTATVNAASGTPTGIVTFLDGTTVLGTGMLKVVCGTDQETFTTSSLSAGTHSITAVYAGTANFSTSTSQVINEVVNKIATTTCLSASPSTTAVGQNVTFAAVVNSCGGTPTGTVTFMDGNTVLGAGTLAVVHGTDQATFTTSSLAAGTHSITAVYAGNGNYDGSTSNAVKETVGKAVATTTCLSASCGTTTVGQSVTFTAVVNSASGTPTGKVTFTDGTTVLGAGTLAVVHGTDQATFTMSSLAVGTHSITAVYAGNSGYDTSTSNTIKETVSKTAPTTTYLSASCGATTVDQSVTFTAVVNADRGTPTGTVTFMDGNTVLGTGTLKSGRGGDQATFTTSSLSVGTHTITAAYSGNANNSASTSSAVIETITKANSHSNYGAAAPSATTGLTSGTGSSGSATGNPSSTASTATAVSAGGNTTRPAASTTAPTGNSVSSAQTSASASAIDFVYGSSEEDDWLS